MKNERFKVLTAMFVASLLITISLRLVIQNDTLYFIRLEQTFGFASLLLLYVCLLISPLNLIFRNNDTMGHLVYIRRALGVSVAYFALLHIIISVWFQFDGLPSLVYLPARFQWSLILGGIAFVILIALTATSLDRAVKALSLKYWKLLHRSVYVASILIIIHVWLIGTHLLNPSIQSVVSLLINILFCLEAYRFSLFVRSKVRIAENPMVFVTVFFLFWFFWVVMLYEVLPSIAENHHRAKQGVVSTEQIISYNLYKLGAQKNT